MIPGSKGNDGASQSFYDNFKANEQREIDPKTNSGHALLRKLKNAGFKLCLVSPELQQHPLEKIKELKQYLKEERIQVDAVCTKEPLIWVSD